MYMIMGIVNNCTVRSYRDVIVVISIVTKRNSKALLNNINKINRQFRKVL